MGATGNWRLKFLQLLSDRHMTLFWDILMSQQNNDLSLYIFLAFDDLLQCMLWRCLNS